eukprot:313180-Chlamydomonas_euryale.AAC.9
MILPANFDLDRLCNVASGSFLSRRSAHGRAGVRNRCALLFLRLDQTSLLPWSFSDVLGTCAFGCNRPIPGSANQISCLTGTLRSKSDWKGHHSPRPFPPTPRALERDLSPLVKLPRIMRAMQEPNSRHTMPIPIRTVLP